MIKNPVPCRRCGGGGVVCSCDYCLSAHPLPHDHVDFSSSLPVQRLYPPVPCPVCDGAGLVEGSTYD